MDFLGALVEQLNRDGFMASSFRGMAEGLGVSPGNLHYHFKNKGAVLTAVFDQIVLETDSLFENGVNPAQLPRQWLTLQFKYVFFFRELPALLLEYPVLRRRYQAIRKQRIQQCATLLGSLVSVGLVAPEPEPDFFSKYSELIWHQCNSVLAFGSAEPTAEAMRNATAMLRVLLLPVLTPAGRGLVQQFGLNG